MRTREEKHRFITQTNRAEKWATFVILSFILIVAAFNILASLTMMLVEKKQDLSILKAMGMKRNDIESLPNQNREYDKSELRIAVLRPPPRRQPPL